MAADFFKVISYRRNAVIDDYYQARLAVDLHNNIRQGQRHTLEQTWASRKWQVRQLAFVMSATMANAYFFYLHFGGHERISFNAFRRMVDYELSREEKKRRHELVDNTARLRRSTSLVEGGHELVHLKKNEGATPGKRTKKPYLQQRCKGENCRTLTRTYCVCNRTLFLCLKRFAGHVLEESCEG